jgi:hypothetical protein
MLISVSVSVHERNHELALSEALCHVARFMAAREQMSIRPRNREGTPWSVAGKSLEKKEMEKEAWDRVRATSAPCLKAKFVDQVCPK